eukprot:6135176-Prymnesium_polylepis.4
MTHFFHIHTPADPPGPLSSNRGGREGQTSRALLLGSDVGALATQRFYRCLSRAAQNSGHD